MQTDAELLSFKSFGLFYMRKPIAVAISIFQGGLLLRTGTFFA